MRWLDEQAIGDTISADISPHLAECIAVLPEDYWRPDQPETTRSVSGPRSTICRATENAFHKPDHVSEPLMMTMAHPTMDAVSGTYRWAARQASLLDHNR